MNGGTWHVDDTRSVTCSHSQQRKELLVTSDVLPNGNNYLYSTGMKTITCTAQEWKQLLLVQHRNENNYLYSTGMKTISCTAQEWKQLLVQHRNENNYLYSTGVEERQTTFSQMKTITCTAQEREHLLVQHRCRREKNYILTNENNYL